MVAGICLLLAGFIGIAYSMTVLSAPLSQEEIDAYQNLTATDRFIVTASGLATIYSQAVAILGGILALQRRSWTLAIVCGVISLLAIGFYGVSSLLGLVGLVILALARSEFTS